MFINVNSFLNEKKLAISDKDIAEKVGVSERTIQNWIKQNGWVAVASAKSISREEIVSKLLNQIHDKVASGSWSPDQIVKAANAVKALDKENGITTIIDVFTQFSHWLEEKIKTSPNLNISDLKTFQSLMDEYVSEIAAKLPK